MVSQRTQSSPRLHPRKRWGREPYRGRAGAASAERSRAKVLRRAAPRGRPRQCQRRGARARQGARVVQPLSRNGRPPGLPACGRPPSGEPGLRYGGGPRLFCRWLPFAPHHHGVLARSQYAPRSPPPDGSLPAQPGHRRNRSVRRRPVARGTNWGGAVPRGKARASAAPSPRWTRLPASGRPQNRCGRSGAIGSKTAA